MSAITEATTANGKHQESLQFITTFFSAMILRPSARSCLTATSSRIAFVPPRNEARDTCPG